MTFRLFACLARSISCFYRDRSLAFLTSGKAGTLWSREMGSGGGGGFGQEVEGSSPKTTAHAGLNKGQCRSAEG